VGVGGEDLGCQESPRPHSKKRFPPKSKHTKKDRQQKEKREIPKSTYKSGKGRKTRGKIEEHNRKGDPKKKRSQKRVNFFFLEYFLDSFFFLRGKGKRNWVVDFFFGG